MPEDKLIDPAWLVKARKDRKKLAYRVVLVFAILSILAWWALPRLEDNYTSVYSQMKVGKRGEKVGSELSSPVRMLLWLAGWFKVLWAAIGIGCLVAVLLAFTGKIDSLLPVFNIGALLVGLGAVGLTIYVFYAPVMLMIEGTR